MKHPADLDRRLLGLLSRVLRTGRVVGLFFLTAGLFHGILTSTFPATRQVGLTRLGGELLAGRLGRLWDLSIYLIALTPLLAVLLAVAFFGRYRQWGRGGIALIITLILTYGFWA